MSPWKRWAALECSQGLAGVSQLQCLPIGPSVRGEPFIGRQQINSFLNRWSGNKLIFFSIWWPAMSDQEWWSRGSWTPEELLAQACWRKPSIFYDDTVTFTKKHSSVFILFYYPLLFFIVTSKQRGTVSHHMSHSLLYADQRYLNKFNQFQIIHQYDSN